MKKLFLIFLLAAAAGSIQAKRTAPEEVKPVEFNGRQYSVIHWGFEAGYKQNGGIIRIWDIGKNELIEYKRIYKTVYDPMIERDKQNNFIVKIEISRDEKYLVITDEKGRMYYLDFGTGKVQVKMD